jgi:hypothetical protein
MDAHRQMNVVYLDATCCPATRAIRLSVDEGEVIHIFTVTAEQMRHYARLCQSLMNNAKTTGTLNGPLDTFGMFEGRDCRVIVCTMNQMLGRN